MRLYACLFLVLGFLTANSVSQQNETSHTHAACAKSISSCPKQGCGGGDPKLDELKNRTDTASSPTAKTVDQIIELTQPAHWTSGQDRSGLKPNEGTLVVVEAYLVHAKNAEPESCNCYLLGAANNDIHMNLTQKQGQTANQSVVAEITPRLHPAGWTMTKLKSLYTQDAFMRVSGWLLFDSEHVSRSGGPRATLWEIHPVSKIEVCSGGNPAACAQAANWQPLESYMPHAATHKKK